MISGERLSGSDTSICPASVVIFFPSTRSSRVFCSRALVFFTHNHFNYYFSQRNGYEKIPPSITLTFSKPFPSIMVSASYPLRLILQKATISSLFSSSPRRLRSCPSGIYLISLRSAILTSLTSSGVLTSRKTTFAYSFFHLG